MGWFLAIIVGLALNVVSYLIMPRPKASKPEAAKDLERPVAEAGKPVPVIWGTVTIKGMNIMWTGDRSKQEHEYGG